MSACPIRNLDVSQFSVIALNIKEPSSLHANTILLKLGKFTNWGLLNGFLLVNITRFSIRCDQ